MILRTKRLLYLTANRLVAHRLSRGALLVDASFERDKQGLAAFAAYLARSNKLYYLVIDVVEEDFHQDVIPHLGGKDRRLVLARRLAQRYRDTDLALSLSLGFEKGERRTEKVLYASFSNAQQFQPWLTALEQSEVRLVGVYSTALLAPTLIKRAGLKVPRCLLVSVQPSGLRQSYVEKEKIRFSRLGHINLEDAAAVAAACAAESARLQQYLVAMRLLPTATTPIDVMVLAPGRYHAALAEVCRSSALLKFHLINAETQCRAGGLRTFPEDAPCDALFLQALALNAPKAQFAHGQQRRPERLWRFAFRLYAAGMAMLAAGLLYAGAQFVDAYGLSQQVHLDQARLNALSAEYARITANFPRTAIPAEDLKATIAQYEVLRAQTASPAYLLVETSKVLSAHPQVEIDRIEWLVGNKRPESGADKVAGPKAGVPGPSPAPTSAADPGYELAILHARVVGARRADVRAISDTANRFIDAFRKIPRLEISGVSMPFELAAGDTIKGEIGAERAVAEDVRFNLTVGRKLGK